MMEKFFKRSFLAVYLVTDSDCLRQRPDRLSLLQGAELALKGGVTMLQYRAKNLDGGRMYEEALALKKLCDAYKVPLIVNDRADIALAVGAAGVHVGQNDMPCTAVRRIAHPGFIIGVSAHNVEEARKAELDGADYLGCGAVFGSSTKKDAAYLGEEGLAQICSSTNLPVTAIGGVNANNYGKVLRCGADGAALVSGILGAPDIRAAAAQFAATKRTFDKSL